MPLKGRSIGQVYGDIVDRFGGVVIVGPLIESLLKERQGGLLLFALGGIVAKAHQPVVARFGRSLASQPGFTIEGAIDGIPVGDGSPAIARSLQQRAAKIVGSGGKSLLLLGGIAEAHVAIVGGFAEIALGGCLGRLVGGTEKRAVIAVNYPQIVKVKLWASFSALADRYSVFAIGRSGQRSLVSSKASLAEKVADRQASELE